MTNKQGRKIFGGVSGAWILIVAIVGCTTSPNPRSCLDGKCEDPAYPFCDFDGDIAGIPTACIAVSCTPGASDACRGDRAVICNAAGDNYDLVPCEHGCNELTRACNQCEPSTSRCEAGVFQSCDAEGRVAIEETCALGCVDGPAPHCAYLEPRYLPDVCDTRALLDDLTIASSATFDTDLDTSCTGGVVPQTGGPSICVVRYGTIAIAAEASLKVIGTRAFAFVADRGLAIDGLLDVGANGPTSGPGGGTFGSGGPVIGPNGSGGAGFKTVGGPGGSPTVDGGAANGGSPSVDPVVYEVLLGGPHSAGGGGGAATMISCRGTVSVPGTISAGGGGGAGGFMFLGTRLPGMGGGAGGYVVLQGLDLAVTGRVFANGGGGGSGVPPVLSQGAQGVNGLISLAPAPGGAFDLGEGHGGLGGSATSNPGPGKRSIAAGSSAGGGGGSMGFFQSYTPAGITPTLAPSSASPGFQANGTVRTR